MDLKDLKVGDRVYIVLKNGFEYTGDVTTVKPDMEMLALSNINDLLHDFTISGTRYFEGSELSEVGKVPNSSECEKNGSKEKLNEEEIPLSEEKSLLTNANHKPKQIEKRKILKPFLNNGLHINGREEVKFDDNFEYFTSFSNELYSALTVLKESEVIGLCAKDSLRGRVAKASVIALATENKIFIFDITALSEKIFDEGVRDILQSPHIRKIVYDCRLLSDCLYHNHKTYLTNVRDVEAEDIMIVFQERGSIRKHSRPFEYLVELYLGKSCPDLDESNIDSTWDDRPLTCEHKKHLAAFSSLLIPLHKKIEEHYVKRLIDISTLYNEFIRDSEPFTALLKSSKYVLLEQIIELVKFKETCRGSKYQ